MLLLIKLIIFLAFRFNIVNYVWLLILTIIFFCPQSYV